MLHQNQNQADNLTEDEIKVLNEIRDAKDVLRGRDSKGIPFLQHVFKLHKKIFNEACSNCPGKLQGYINNLKKFNPQKQKIMSDKKLFKLREGVIIPVAGTSESYSNANITDEKAIELLAINPNRKALFQTLPKNVDELVEEFKNKSSKPSTDDDLKEFVKIGDYSLTVEETQKVLETAKIKTRATTVTGVQKFVDELKDEDKKEVFQLAKDLVEAKHVVTGQPDTTDSTTTETVTEAVVKTLEELQFDLEKAEQDLEDLKANQGSQEQIAIAEKNIDALKQEIAKTI